MTTDNGAKMHADEVATDEALVRRLLAAQFPQWARLPIVSVRSAGSSNALYRIGDDMVARLPRRQGAAVEKEQRWLPLLAPHLPLDIPRPLALGAPGAGYPWPWSIHQWLKGESADTAPPAELAQAARDLARFIAALRQIDPTGGPPPGEHNAYRGEPLINRDAEARAAIAELRGALDVDVAIAAWEAALRAPAWAGPDIWIHGDLLPANLLVQRRRLSAVIDFGCLGVGDPACDVMVAWTLLTAESRAVFRHELAVDDATWARGAGWALSFGLIALPYYQQSNPALARVARYAIDEALADYQRAPSP